MIVKVQIVQTMVILLDFLMAFVVAKNSKTMSHLEIDLTGLTPKQISQVQALVERLKENTQKEASQEKPKKDEDKDLQELHQEFDWLIADLGIKNALHRSEIYGIE